MNNEEFLDEFDLDSRAYVHETLVMNVTEDILVAMEEKNVTKAELARLLHKSKSFVTQTLSGSRNMTLRTLADIAFNLDLDVSIGFKHKASYVETEHGSPQWDKNDNLVICLNTHQRYCLSEITSNDSSWHTPKNIARVA